MSSLKADFNELVERIRHGREIGHASFEPIYYFIGRVGTVDGKRLTEQFTDDPFGWSQDTLRYVVAAMLVAGEIKLKVSGREVTVNGQQAIDALKTNNSFRSVGVALREGRPSNDVLARAASRLTDLIGEPIIPLEADISKAATKYFPQFQHQFTPLAEKLAGLALSEDDRLRDLNKDLADVLLTDASDAPQRLGGEESILYDSLKWASEVKQALENGLEQTVRQLQQHRSAIEVLPDSVIPAQLKSVLTEELILFGERPAQADFYQHAADFSTFLTSLRTRVRDAAGQMEEAQTQHLQEAAQDPTRLPEWGELTQEEHNTVMAILEDLVLTVSHDLQELKALINQQFVRHSRVSELKDRIARQGEDRRRQRLEAEKAKANQEGKTKLTRAINVPPAITEASQLDTLIQELQALRQELALYSDMEVRMTIRD